MQATNIGMGHTVMEDNEQGLLGCFVPICLESGVGLSHHNSVAEEFGEFALDIAKFFDTAHGV